MAKKATTKKAEPDRVKFEGNWEDLAGKMIQPAPKPAPRKVKTRKKRSA